MTVSTMAVYEKGVLRTLNPLQIAEGEKVQISLTPSAPDKPRMSEEEAIRRIREAKTLEEWVEAANSAPDDDDGYDFLKALDENRIGERPLFPPEMKGISW